MKQGTGLVFQHMRSQSTGAADSTCGHNGGAEWRQSSLVQWQEDNIIKGCQFKLFI